MKLTHEVRTVHTRHTFTIARGGASAYRVVTALVTDADGAEGWGEAAPSRFYGENADTVVAALALFAPVLEHCDPWTLEDIEAELGRVLRWNAAARSAVSAALHDLAARRLGVPLYRMLGLDPARAPRTSFTIAIAEEGELRAKVRDAADYPILKVKLGTDHDEAIVRAVREEAPQATIRVDANAAWSQQQALRTIERIARYGVEFVEQPLAPHDIEGLRFVHAHAALPIIADESCLVATDIPRLAGAVDGINIKLAKCGGLREAVRMTQVARAHGLRVMMGCMIETSLGITAAAHLAPLLDYADLDGAALLADDPFRGASIAGGVIVVPQAPGLGVTLASPVPAAKPA